MFHLHADEKTPSPRGYTRSSWGAGMKSFFLGAEDGADLKTKIYLLREYLNDWGMLDKYLILFVSICYTIPLQAPHPTL